MTLLSPLNSSWWAASLSWETTSFCWLALMSFQFFWLATGWCCLALMSFLCSWLVLLSFFCSFTCFKIALAVLDPSSVPLLTLVVMFIVILNSCSLTDCFTTYDLDVSSFCPPLFHSNATANSASCLVLHKCSHSATSKLRLRLTHFDCSWWPYWGKF